MRRLVGIITVGVAVCLTLVGCSNTTTSTVPSGSQHGVKDGAPAAPSLPERYAEIAIGGPHEKAALAAVPAALESNLGRIKNSESMVPDLSALKPTFTAYIVSAMSDDTMVLFEVHADGVAHPLYNWSASADASNIMKQSPAFGSEAILVEPTSDAEKAAVAATKAVLDTAIPDKDFSVKIAGYRFSYITGRESMLQLEINPDGGVISIR